jgi:hypothetical protein
MSKAGLLLLLGLLGGNALSGCAAFQSRPKICAVHGEQMSTVRGFAPATDVHIDPGEEYLDFSMAVDPDQRYPNAVPWYFRTDKTKEWSRAVKVVVCRKCEADQDTAYERYLKKRGIE